MVSVFTYTNYRHFLRDKFLEEKKQKRGFSYRSFNRKAGVSSSSFLKLIIDGKRNLSLDGVGKIAKAFVLTESESTYFLNLVLFNQAKNEDEKNLYFKKMAHHYHDQKIKILKPEQSFIFSKWYYFPILESIRIKADKRMVKDEHWVKKNITPTLGLQEIKTALKRMVQSGLLKRTSSGYVRAETFLSSTEEMVSSHFQNFYGSYCDQAKKALQEKNVSSNSFSVLSIAVSKKAYEMAKEEMLKFTKQLHVLLEDKSLGEKEMVAHINMQLFQIGKEKTP